MNLPNKLTVLRIIMIPIFVALFYVTALPYNYVLSAVIFALAAFTDFLDGHIARKHNLVTDFGKFLDPIADKVLVSTALIVMLFPYGETKILEWYGAICVAVIMARELIVSGFRLIAANKGMVIAADWSGKIKTFLTDVAIVVLLVSANFIESFAILNLIGKILLYVSTALTIYSGIECLVKNKGVISDK